TAVASDLVEPRDRLRVVVEDVRPRVDHDLERLRLALEVWDEELDAAARREAPDGVDGRGEDLSASIREIVAVDRGDDYVLEAELAHRASYAFGLLTVLPHRLAVRDGAVAAIPRAGVAEDHEGGRGVFPALADVRAVGLLAHRVEVPLAHEPLEPDVVRATGRAHLEPGGLRGGGGPRSFEEGKRKSHEGLSLFPSCWRHYGTASTSATGLGSYRNARRASRRLSRRPQCSAVQ